jgi:hypothetical protein
MTLAKTFIKTTYSTIVNISVKGFVPAPTDKLRERKRLRKDSQGKQRGLLISIN